MRHHLGTRLRGREGSPRIRRGPTRQDAPHPVLSLQRTAGNQAVLRALGASPNRSEAEADRVGSAVAAAVEPIGATESHRQRGTLSGERLAPSLLERLEAFLGWDLGSVRIHESSASGSEAGALGARAFTKGNDVFFSPGSFRPETQAGLGLLGHELGHVQQQTAGQAPWAVAQRKEDWDFTPADYAALVKGKKELRFDADSAWFPKALQENLLTTLKFTLTSTKPARTAGVNVKDFYHGHFVVPRGKMSGLSTKTSEFETKSEALQGKALGGH